MVDEKSTLPPPEPDEITAAPVRVTGALISIKPSAVVIFAAMFNAVAFTAKDESPVVPPTAPPRVIVPDPLVRVRPVSYTHLTLPTKA